MVEVEARGLPVCFQSPAKPDKVCEDGDPSNNIGVAEILIIDDDRKFLAHSVILNELDCLR